MNEVLKRQHRPMQLAFVYFRLDFVGMILEKSLPMVLEIQSG